MNFKKWYWVPILALLIPVQWAVDTLKRWRNKQ